MLLFGGFFNIWGTCIGLFTLHSVRFKNRKLFIMRFNNNNTISVSDLDCLENILLIVSLKSTHYKDFYLAQNKSKFDLKEIWLWKSRCKISTICIYHPLWPRTVQINFFWQMQAFNYRSYNHSIKLFRWSSAIRSQECECDCSVCKGVMFLLALFGYNILRF